MNKLFSLLPLLIHAHLLVSMQPEPWRDTLKVKLENLQESASCRKSYFDTITQNLEWFGPNRHAGIYAALEKETEEDDDTIFTRKYINHVKMARASDRDRLLLEIVSKAAAFDEGAACVDTVFASGFNPGPDYPIPSAIDNSQPLFVASLFGASESVKALLKHAFNREKVSNYGFSSYDEFETDALGRAITGTHCSDVLNQTLSAARLAIIRTLLAAGVKPIKTIIKSRNQSYTHTPLTYLMQNYDTSDDSEGRDNFAPHAVKTLLAADVDADEVSVPITINVTAREMATLKAAFTDNNKKIVEAFSWYPRREQNSFAELEVGHF